MSNYEEGKIIVEHKDEGMVKTEEPPKPPEEERGTLNEITSSVRELAQKLPESIGKLPGSIGAAIQSALTQRDNSVTVRLSDEQAKMLDLLVDAGIFENRPDAAVFLVQEGIKAQADLFMKVSEKVNQIEQLRSELKTIVKSDK